MNYNEIVQLISCIGFPIVAYLLQVKLCNDTLNKLTDAINDLKEAVNKNESKN